MAMRRLRGRRFSGRKKQPLRLNWVNTLFAGTLDDTAAALTALIVLDKADWGGNVASRNIPVYVRRIRVEYTYTFAFDFVDERTVQGTILSALLIEDEDETETSLTSTAVDSLQQQNRILGTHLWAYQHITDDQPIVGNALSYPPVLTIDWKGRVLMRANEELSMISQMMDNESASLTAVGYRAYSRVLIEQP